MLQYHSNIKDTAWDIAIEIISLLLLIKAEWHMDASVN